MWIKPKTEFNLGIQGDSTGYFSVMTPDISN